MASKVDVRDILNNKNSVVIYINNQIGCDGGRLFFDGCAMIWQNGSLL